MENFFSLGPKYKNFWPKSLIKISKKCKKYNKKKKKKIFFFFEKSGTE